MSGLPRLIVLTDRTACVAGLVATVATAVGCGARAVVLREKDLPGAERADLANQLREILDPVGGTLIIAGPDAARVGGSTSTGPATGDGVHLAAADPVPSPRPVLLGRSCHDATEVARAAAEGCDYVTVSPVYPTGSKPGYGPALGPGGLASLLFGPPGYALGGVLPEHVPACLAAGARGVAVMGPIMREPRRVVDYLAELPELP